MVHQTITNYRCLDSYLEDATRPQPWQGYHEEYEVPFEGFRSYKMLVERFPSGRLKHFSGNVRKTKTVFCLACKRHGREHALELKAVVATPWNSSEKKTRISQTGTKPNRNMIWAYHKDSSAYIPWGEDSYIKQLAFATKDETQTPLTSGSKRPLNDNTPSGEARAAKHSRLQDFKLQTTDNVLGRAKGSDTKHCATPSYLSLNSLSESVDRRDVVWNMFQRGMQDGIWNASVNAPPTLRMLMHEKKHMTNPLYITAGRKFFGKHVDNIEAALVQMSGVLKEDEAACDNCYDGKSIFVGGCRVRHDIKKGSCGGCIYNKGASRCSFRARDQYRHSTSTSAHERQSVGRSQSYVSSSSSELDSDSFYVSEEPVDELLRNFQARCETERSPSDLHGSSPRANSVHSEDVVVNGSQNSSRIGPVVAGENVRAPSAARSSSGPEPTSDKAAGLANLAGANPSSEEHVSSGPAATLQHVPHRTENLSAGEPQATCAARCETAKPPGNQTPIQQGNHPSKETVKLLQTNPQKLPTPSDPHRCSPKADSSRPGNHEVAYAETSSHSVASDGNVPLNALSGSGPSNGSDPARDQAAGLSEPSRANTSSKDHVPLGAAATLQPADSLMPQSYPPFESKIAQSEPSHNVSNQPIVEPSPKDNIATEIRRLQRQRRMRQIDQRLNDPALNSEKRLLQERRILEIEVRLMELGVVMDSEDIVPRIGSLQRQRRMLQIDDELDESDPDDETRLRRELSRLEIEDELDTLGVVVDT